MKVLRPEQLADLRDLQTTCQKRNIAVVIIGAMAYRLFIDDVDRETADIDLAVAVDAEDLAEFAQMLEGLGWRRNERMEQRWQTARGVWMDVLPAGPELRRQRKFEWPASRLVMSLAGFEHVFQHAVILELASGFAFPVVPPTVLALLKISSYLDDPYGRAKDLLDLQRLWHRYERDGERLFSDDVFQADLADVEYAGAFLLGTDLRQIATEADLQLIRRFLARLEESLADAPALDAEGRNTERARQQAAAFGKGLRLGG